MSYKVIGEWDFTKSIPYAAADTETHDYYNGKLLNDEDKEFLMRDNGQAWYKENIEVRAWAFMLSDGISTIVFDNIQEFINCCCTNRIKTVVWYNGKFDWLFFDDYFCKNNWNYSNQIAEEYKTRKHYGKMPAKTYQCLNGSQGNRYSMTIWEEYMYARPEKNRRGNTRYVRKVHKFKMIDLCNVVHGGLARCLKDFDVKDENGNPVRKLEMDYVNGTFEDSWQYLHNDTYGLKLLADKVDETFLELTGMSLWNGDYLTAGGLAKKELLRCMYESTDDKRNLKLFQMEYPMSAELDELFRQDHLYRGGMAIVNPRYKGKVVQNIFKYDENSMYPDKMYYMKWPYGWPLKKELIDDNTENLVIVHTTSIYGKLKKDKCPVFYDIFSKEYTDTIFVKEPQFFFKIELDELAKHYDLSFEYDYVFEYKTQENKGAQKFVDKYYTIKRTAKGAKRAASKLQLNSSYGKLSEKIDHEYGHHVLSDKGYLVYQEDGKERDAKNIMNVVCGSLITALARIDLMKSMRKVCAENTDENFVYCDTDSIHSLTDYIETNDTVLGMYKNEGYNKEPYQLGIYLAPKSYIMYNEHDEEEPYVIHAKGVSIKELERLIIGQPFSEALKIFRAGYPIRSLTGLNVQGGKSLVYKDKFILREDNTNLDKTTGTQIFFES